MNTSKDQKVFVVVDRSGTYPLRPNYEWPLACIFKWDASYGSPRVFIRRWILWRASVTNMWLLQSRFDVKLSGRYQKFEREFGSKRSAADFLLLQGRNYR